GAGRADARPGLGPRLPVVRRIRRPDHLQARSGRRHAGGTDRNRQNRSGAARPGYPRRCAVVLRRGERLDLPPRVIARRDFLLGLSAAAAAMATRSLAAAPAASPTWMYVGSFTGQGRGHGEGLTVFHRAGDADRWLRVQVLAELADPSFVIVDRR